MRGTREEYYTRKDSMLHFCYQLFKYDMLKHGRVCLVPLSSLSEESLLPEDEDPVFTFVTFVIS